MPPDWDVVVAINYIGFDDYYDIHVPYFENYLANGVWNHNTGKTIMQLAWADQVCKHTGGNVLIHCPVAIRHQTVAESEKFEIDTPVRVVNDQSDVRPGISLVNYEKLHKFDSRQFAGVVLDESSILKSYTGVTKRALCENWSHANFRLACTATPAPNDYMELGNHCEFLGVMTSSEMLSRWFINDTMKAGGYRLRGHGEKDFWRWVSGWAVSVQLPSDIGGDDEGYILPPLNRVDVVIEEPHKPGNGVLIDATAINATTVHKQKRRTTDARAKAVADLVNPSDEAWVVWCNTDYEADALVKRIPEAVEVRGSHSESVKEARLLGFAHGEYRIIITKPTVAGFGLNWQHCHNMAFIGLGWSFEEFYQAVRRCLRFGQEHVVNCYVVQTDGELALTRAVAVKQSGHEQMQRSMNDAVRLYGIDQCSEDMTAEVYIPRVEMELPKWICSKTPA